MDQRVEYALKIMKANCGAHLSLSRIAGAVDLSPSRFRHLFKQETGQSYASYLRELRLIQAKDLLADRRLSIKQIANQVGYPHPRNFVRVFKKRFGKPPSQYGKEIPQHLWKVNSPLGEQIAHWESK